MRRGPYKKTNRASTLVAREVVDLIDRSGWTDTEVSIAAGIAPCYLSQIRSGRRTDPSSVCLEAVLGVFGRRLRIGMIDTKDRHLDDPTKQARPLRPRPTVKTKRKVGYAGQEEN